MTSIIVPSRGKTMETRNSKNRYITLLNRNEKIFALFMNWNSVVTYKISFENIYFQKKGSGHTQVKGLVELSRGLGIRRLKDWGNYQGMVRINIKNK